jgi:hypothetical protein
MQVNANNNYILQLLPTCLVTVKVVENIIVIIIYTTRYEGS